MAFVKPGAVVDAMIDSGAEKASLSIKDLLIRGALAGAFLGFGTTLAFTTETQTSIGMLGALVFPACFVLVVLLGLELVTGSFALIPVAVMAKKTTNKAMLNNWFWVIVGHLIGAALYAILYLIGSTNFFQTMDTPVLQKIVAVAESKTIGYASLGSIGFVVVFVKAMLCNWMVTLGAIMAMTSTSTIGKIVAMWLPIFIFFAQGFEHAVVNMFVIPAGMMLGADVTFSDWWIWNQIPVLIGNLVSGFLFTGVALYMTHHKREKSAAIKMVHTKTS
ncbi:formate/nitrite transporter family protein [Aureibacillus halotolerans]|uniref:Formate/nitrite transporter n=1 Tax=Aureibacillus halotolerans TaxID=1508390 RepID=A0A4R6UCV7_9BACI|nr:formate/nitrite transporter family protein [Aureibacillus halotolerans]TDQ42595.1 formate/nitrite transporter [Aureibacillus halotolerans]